MFIAMNRFRVIKNATLDFEQVWLSYYPPPRWHVFLALNQQVTPISNRYRVVSNSRRDASGAASCEAVWVVSSGTLLA
jgi:hypothetical protein